VAEIIEHRLENGLTLAIEPRPGHPGAAFHLLVPAGATTDPEDALGANAVLEHWLWKGAGSRDARAFAEALDALGVRRSSSAGLEYTTFSAAFLAEVFEPALGLFADLVRRPRLPEEGFLPARRAVEEELAGLEDNPPKKLFVRLREEVFKSPHGRNVEGTKESLMRLMPERVRAEHARRYAPKGAILAVAGGLDPERVVALAERYFGDWAGAGVPLPEPALAPKGSYRFPDDTAQVQIGLYYEDVPPDSPDFYPARLASEVLSGGMASRLFTEVREKRGLVYSVYASPGAVKGFGYLAAYAGTTPERAEETRRVLKAEIEKLKAGVSADELARAKVGVKSALVMQGESVQARSASLARDLFLLGRARSLDEILKRVEAVGLEELNAFLARHPYTLPWEGVLGPVEGA